MYVSSQLEPYTQAVPIPNSPPRHLCWFSHLGSLLVPSGCDVTIELVHPYGFPNGVRRETITTREVPPMKHYSLDDLFSIGLPDLVLRQNPIDNQGYYVQKVLAVPRAAPNQTLLALERDLPLTLKDPKAEAEGSTIYKATLAPRLYQDSRLQKLFTTGRL